MLKTNRELIALFQQFPDVRNIVKEYKLYPHNRLVVPRVKGASPTLIGTAYDFWCRAFIQQVNGREIETVLSKQVLHGVFDAKALAYITEEEKKELLVNVHAIWEMRAEYIQRKNIDEDKLLKGCLILAYCEQTFRSNEKPEIDYLTIKRKDFDDLKNLATETKNMARIFQTKKSLYMNPTFGEYSRKVGGADADYIIGNMLVDIKTSAYRELKKEYIIQLLCYSFLARLQNKRKIHQIGVFMPRFGRLSYIEIEDFKKIIDIEQKFERFRDIICK